MQDSANQIDEDLFGRHYNKSAQGGAADGKKLGGVDEREDLTPGHGKATQHRAQNHDESSNNEHLKVSVPTNV